jgi:hypothetical protein
MGTQRPEDVCIVCHKKLSGGNMVFCSDDHCYQLFMEWRDLDRNTDARPALYEYYQEQEKAHHSGN